MTLGSVLAVNLLNAKSLITAGGEAGVGAVLFAETGLLVGFFLPGDSLLFTAGVLSATSARATVHLSLGWTLLAAALGALAGAEVGYLIGLRTGPLLFDREDRPKLREAVARAHHYVARYGTGKAIMLARFVPFVRTVMNPVAGIIRIPLREFTVWQVAGGLVWSLGVTVAGYALGSSISNVDHYLLPIIGVIIVLSLIPVGLEVWRTYRGRAGAA